VGGSRTRDERFRKKIGDVKMGKDSSRKKLKNSTIQEEIHKEKGSHLKNPESLGKKKRPRDNGYSER